MRFLPVGPTALVLAMLFFAAVQGDNAAAQSSQLRAGTGLSLTCRAVSTAPKPFLEAVEDGIAYVLDIPLAMLSPLMCPIVAPIMEKLDSGPDRQYHRCAPR